MHKVLMVVYSWPPRGGVGMLRTLKFAQYLERYGWQPTILTPRDAPSQIRCDEEDAGIEGVRVIKSGYRNSIIHIPDRQAGWYRPAMEIAGGFVSEERFDIIFSSSPPETSHLIARALKRKFGIPWVADMRDPWADYHHIRHRNPFMYALNKQLEKRTLADADHIVTVSETWGRVLRNGYGQRVSTITNGFDEEDMNKAPSGLLQNGKFNITYAGKLHAGTQNPDIFFRALQSLMHDGRLRKDELAVNFYTFGAHQPDYRSIGQRMGLGGALHVLPPVTQSDILGIMKNSDLLLLFDWSGDDEISRGVIPVKAFEYIAARRPILLLSSKERSDLKAIISKTRNGRISSTIEGAKRVIMEAYESKKLGHVPGAGFDDDTGQYSRLNLTGCLARIFDTLQVRHRQEIVR